MKMQMADGMEMKNEFKPIKFDELDLSEEEKTFIADGARRYLDVGPDPNDGDVFNGTPVDGEPES